VQILNSVCLETGLSRDRAKRLLCGCIRKVAAPRTKKQGRKSKYDDCTLTALKKIWAFMDFAYGRRIAAGMEEIVNALSVEKR